MRKQVMALFGFMVVMALSSCSGNEPETSRVSLPPVQTEAVIFEPSGLTVAAGHSSGFFIKPDGSLWGLGSNSTGQMGNGETTWWGTPHMYPIHIMDYVYYVSSQGRAFRSANTATVHAIRTDGSLWGWGHNDYGQLGDGTTTYLHKHPVHIMDDVIAVSTGGTHAAAILADGSLWVWGRNNLGQLGNGTTQDSRVPIHVMDNVKAVSVGRFHTLALGTDGVLWAWGHPPLLGAESENSTLPTKIMSDIVTIAAGHEHSMALCSNANLWAWGANRFGQLGNGTAQDNLTPIKIMENVIYVDAAKWNSAAIQADGSLWVWGCNIVGQLGSESFENSMYPIRIMENVTSVSLGGYITPAGSQTFIFAVQADGSMWTWGDNYFGQLGDGYSGLLYRRTTPARIDLF